MFAFSFYVPLDHAEAVKEAVFAAGAGKIGNYSHCAWQTLGEGQFIPNEGANPAIGSHNQVEKVKEVKIEMVCDAVHIHLAIEALKKSHPYETPAYHVVRLEPL